MIGRGATHISAGGIGCYAFRRNLVVIHQPNGHETVTRVLMLCEPSDRGPHGFDCEGGARDVAGFLGAQADDQKSDLSCFTTPAPHNGRRHPAG